ncbi:hypothetical protein [Actinoplanes sp. NPDC023714]|uniref:hypothetical protein n=1 Tax=Actinoplanes sp. NPDC023714 TaxID=3154322 RepID=UPI0033C7C201
MRVRNRISTVLSAALLSIAVAAPAPAAAAAAPQTAVPQTAAPQAATGRLIALRTLGGRESTAGQANARGDLAGSTQNRAGTWQAAVWWQGRRNPIALRVPDASAWAISDNRYIAGEMNRGRGGMFRWHKGKVTYRWNPAGTRYYVASVNNRGQVVGTAFYDDGSSRAFLWQRGRLTLLAQPAGARSEGVAVNNHGQAIGVVTPKGTWNAKAVLWQHGRLRWLGTLGGARSEAVAINDRGQVAGDSQTKDSFMDHPFLWQHGRMTDLLRGTAATSGDATAINRHGVVAGRVQFATGHGNRAVLWRHHRMTVLPVPGQSIFAEVINDRGEAGGTAWNVNPAGGGDFGVPFRWSKGRVTVYPRPAVDREVRVIGISRYGTMSVLLVSRAKGSQLFRTA